MANKWKNSLASERDAEASAKAPVAKKKGVKGKPAAAAKMAKRGKTSAPPKKPPASKSKLSAVKADDDLRGRLP